MSPQNTFFSMMELAIIEFNVAWILTESGSPSGKERSMHSTSSRVDLDSVKLVLSRAMTALPLPASSSSSSSSWSPCPAQTVSLPRLMPKHFGLAYSFMHDSDTTALPNCKSSPMTSSTSGGKALLILTNADKQGGNKALRSSTVKTDNNVESAFIARRAMEYDLGKAY